MQDPSDQSLGGAASGADKVDDPYTLREVEEHFAELISGVEDHAIFLLDRNGILRTWNAGAKRIKGYAAEEIIGQPFTRFYTEESRASGWPQEELRRAAQDGRFEDEGWRVCKDGTRIWANVVITARHDDNGQIRGYLKITRDLTERKQAEETLRQSEERLPTTGAGSDPALLARFGYASASEQGWSVGNRNPNLETGSTPGGTSTSRDRQVGLHSPRISSSSALARAMSRSL